MSFNRNKSLTKAQKLLQKGKVQEAIAEFKEVVENDPTDVRTLLKVGDLYAKVGDIEAACDAYHKVGEQYAKDGFFLKAVAVFKQILKLDPGLVRIYLRLAELYQQLGLNSEAMKQYQVVVRHYENQGLKKESLDVLRKMSELDPENTASRVKLAELYAREGHQEASAEQFRGIAGDLAKKGNHQDLARVYEKMEALGLADDPAKVELAELYLKLAEPKKALAKLQDLFKADPHNPPVLELLARTFIELQQPEKAKSVYSELVHVLDMQGMALERDRIMAKLKALGVSVVAGPAAQIVPDDYDIEMDLVEPEAEPTTIEPKAAAPSPPPPPAPAAPAPKAAQPPKILQEADVFLKYGLVEKACQMLSNAVMAEPWNESIRKKLAEGYREKNDPDGLIGVLTRAAAVAEKLGKKEAAAAIRTEIEQAAPPAPEIEAVETAVLEASEPEPEVPVLEAVPEVEIPIGGAIDMEIVEDEPVALAAPAASEPEAAPPVFESEFSFDLSAPEAAVPEEVIPETPAPPAPAAQEAAPEVDFGAEFERGEESLPPDLGLDLGVSVADPEPLPEMLTSDVAAEPAVEAEVSEPESSEPGPIALDLPPVEAMEAEISEPIALDLPPVDADEVEAPEPDLAEVAAAETVFEPKAGPADEPVKEPEAREPEVRVPGTPQPDEDVWAAEMEEAAFFAQQGLIDEAVEVYEGILGQEPTYRPAQERLLEIKAARPAPPPLTPQGEPERRQVPRPSRPELRLEEEVSAPRPKATERVLREEAARQEPTPEAPPRAEGQEGLFDLSSELADEIHELEEELGRKPAIPDEDEEYLSPEEVITEFKKGVQRTVAKGDHQTHYNLGIAYKEMGLLNEAIGEFELASENPKMAVDCASMIGLCLIGKQDFRAAIDVYRKALGKTSPQSEEALGLSYELAEAYIGNGNMVEAYKLFARIRDVDPGFRDVRRRGKELEADLGSAAPPPSAPEKKDKSEQVVKIPGKKNKISYI